MAGLARLRDRVLGWQMRHIALPILHRWMRAAGIDKFTSGKDV